MGSGISPVLDYRKVKVSDGRRSVGSPHSVGSGSTDDVVGGEGSAVGAGAANLEFARWEDSIRVQVAPDVLPRMINVRSMPVRDAGWGG